MPAEGPGCQAYGTTNSPGGTPRLLVREKLAQRGPSSRISAKKFAPHNPSSRISAKKFAQRGIKHPFWAIFRVLGELFRAYTMTTVPQGELFRAPLQERAMQGENIAHRSQKHGDVETNNTTAHPQQGTIETAITSAPEKHTKNAHFPPAKAMPVSIPYRHQQAKATMVSNHRATWPTGPGRSAGGPFRAHVNPMTCTWATPPRRTSRGLRAHQRVNTHVQWFACEQHTMPGAVVPKTQTTTPTAACCHRFSPRWSALWAPHHLTSGPHCRQSGGIALHEAPTRRRHASRGLHVVQTPHLHRHGGRRRVRRARAGFEARRRTT